MCDCYSLMFICFYIDIFIWLLKNILVIEVLLLYYIFVCYPYCPTFRLSDLGVSHIRSDNRDSTVALITIKGSPLAARKTNDFREFLERNKVKNIKYMITNFGIRE